MPFFAFDLFGGYPERLEVNKVHTMIARLPASLFACIPEAGAATLSRQLERSQIRRIDAPTRFCYVPV